MKELKDALSKHPNVLRAFERYVENGDPERIKDVVEQLTVYPNGTLEAVMRGAYRCGFVGRHVTNYKDNINHVPELVGWFKNYRTRGLEGQRVLDIGGGHGLFAMWAAAQGADVWVVEHSITCRTALSVAAAIAELPLRISVMYDQDAVDEFDPHYVTMGRVFYESKRMENAMLARFLSQERGCRVVVAPWDAEDPVEELGVVDNWLINPYRMTDAWGVERKAFELRL